MFKNSLGRKQIIKRFKNVISKFCEINSFFSYDICRKELSKIQTSVKPNLKRSMMNYCVDETTAKLFLL